MGDKRKDSKKRMLKDGEYERSNGTYEYRWRDKNGGRHSIYAKSLDELREKEAEALRDLLNGKKYVNKDLTINDMYDRWVEPQVPLHRAYDGGCLFRSVQATSYTPLPSHRTQPCISCP